jgi:uncharacterized LabA/DUF88 family protein
VSKNVAMFIDVANIYYAARGQDVDVDYVALLKHATKGRDLIRAYAYSGLDPENENQRKFIDFLSKNGYKVVTKDIRKFGDGRVKANLDIELVVDLFRLSDRMDIAVIVSGDGDFAPAIRALQDTGVRCEVISFKPNTSSDLIAVADEFQDIQKIAGIGRKKGEGSRADAMAMPEMPAKEVVPEFGFREASPSVAAAALAAIRTGGTTRGGAARGARSRVRTPAAAAEESDEGTVAAEAAPVAAATNGDADEPARRRRRRRGGRGRSRGRREEAVEAALPAADAEIGWEEFDDLSQLEGLDEEREYTFSEADPETLRELGMFDGDSVVADGAEPVAEPEAPVAEAAVVEEAKPRARRRSTRAKGTEALDAGGEAGAAAPAQGPEEPKPRARRRSTRAAAATDAEAPAAEEPKPRRRRNAATTEAQAAEDSAAKPTRRRSTRSRTVDAEAAEGSASEAPAAGQDTPPAEQETAPQGIWGRFRAGRGQRD